MTDNGSGSSATYSYLANSPLVGQIAFANGGQTRMTTTKHYDYLNRLTSISSVPSAAAVVSFAYQYNSANQRTAVTANDGSYWTYGYDPLGQVTNGFKSWADTTLVAGEQFQYGFDTIGNRTSTAAGGDSSGAGLRTASYHANLLNQYTNRDVPGAFDVLGLALATNTTVAVNGQTPYRRSEFFRQQLSVTNTSSAVWQSVSVTATNAGTTTGNVFIAQTPEHFTYDLDGNLTSDGHWSYTWDAENRLIGMTNIASTAPAQGLAFGYDWKWRRVQKQVWYSGSLTNNTTFLYDGWNLTARLNATNSGLAQSYLWGLDLSGSPQGAGGVGGLLEVSDTANGSHFTAFDGNGNVAALFTAGSGTNSAAYEYGAFGELFRATGPTCKMNALSFSTKFRDDETGLLHYAHRYYDAGSGRWLSRDPLGDVSFLTAFSRGSRRQLQLLAAQAYKPPYLLLQNNPVGATDSLGLCPAGTCNKWRITVDNMDAGGAGPGLLWINGWLHADTSCCMGGPLDYDSRYKYLGVGIGGGIDFSFSVDVGSKWFTTPCIKWDAHNGWGRVTAGGVGIIVTYGTTIMTTPQTYVGITSPSWGVDASIITSIGRWRVERQNFDVPPMTIL